MWVPAYSQIPGNEKVDKLEKEVVKTENIEMNVNHRGILRSLKSGNIIGIVKQREDITRIKDILEGRKLINRLMRIIGLISRV